MKTLAFLVSLVAALVSGALMATAQAWPTRNVTLVVPLGAGGGADVVGRLIAGRLTELLGQSVVVENVVGAGGMVGASRVAKAAPDGYQVLLGTVGTHAQNQTLYKRPLYDSTRDFEPVALMVELPVVLALTKGLPAKNLSEFGAYAKANQAKMQFGSPGAGSSNHLACLLLNATLGIDVTHIPYRGAGELFQDLVSGRIDYFCPTSTAALPMFQGNQANITTVLGQTTLPIFPGVTSAGTQGYPNLETGTWFALFLPKGTPADIVAKLNAATNAALSTPALQQRLTEIGASVVAPDRRTPDALAKWVASETAKWAGPIKATGVQIE
jgi:tripartite-type tricarboxylate transporter receptor subunit TctC